MRPAGGEAPSSYARSRPEWLLADVAQETVYRLRAGPLPHEPSAAELCEALSQRRVGCLVVRE